MSSHGDFDWVIAVLRVESGTRQQCRQGPAKQSAGLSSTNTLPTTTTSPLRTHTVLLGNYFEARRLAKHTVHVYVALKGVVVHK
jgi:DUF1365 family protein